MNEVNYHHFTLDDNPALSEQDLIKIKNRYDPDSIYYKRYVLGQRVNAEGLIYNVRDYNIFEDVNLEEYGRYIVLADPGINTSATAFILLGLKRDHSGVDVLKEYWHRNADHKGLAIKMPSDYALDFADFINECAKYMGYRPYKILSDLDITFQREFDRIKFSKGIGYALLDVSKPPIEERIKTGLNYLYQGRLRFHKDCKKTIQSFKEAQYDSKKASQGKFERLDDPTQGTMIDGIDVVEYGFTEFELELDRYRN
jgi:PBSX family phage terminase large subunit